MTKQLAVITVEKSIVPKPTKAEVIDAMTQIRLKQNEKANKAVYDRREKATKALHKAAKSVGSKKTQADMHPSTYRWGGDESRYYIQLETKVLFSEIPKLIIDEYMASNKAEILSTDFKVVRKMISDGVAGMKPKDERIELMLGDAATRKALEEMVAAIN